MAPPVAPGGLDLLWQIAVKVDGRLYAVEASPAETVAAVRRRVVDGMADAAASERAVLLAGRVLPDSQPLQAAGVGDGSLLELAPAVSPPALALVLLLSTAATVGSSYCAELPASLMKQLEFSMELSALRYNLWYTASYAAAFLCAAVNGGDWGPRRSGAAGAAGAAVAAGGQVLFAFGWGHGGELGYWATVFGRALLGLGGEALLGAQQGLLAEWFRQADNAQYFWCLGFTFALGRLLPAACFTLSPLLLQRAGHLGAPLWAGAGLSLASAAAGLALAGVDAACRPLASPPPAAPREVAALLAKAQEGGSGRGRGGGWLSSAGALLVGLGALGCAAILPFASAGSAFLQDRYYGEDCGWVDSNSSCRAGATHRANLALSVPYVVAAVAMPFVVWLVDQHGRRPLGCVLATAGLVAVYAALLLRPDAASLVLPLMAALGAAYALLSATVWPAIHLEARGEAGRAWALRLAAAARAAALCLAHLLLGLLQTELGHEGSGSGAAEERGLSNYGPLLRQQLVAAAAAAALALALCAVHAARRGGSAGLLNMPTHAVWRRADDTRLLTAEGSAVNA
jgi:MFS family permease